MALKLIESEPGVILVDNNDEKHLTIGVVGDADVLASEEEQVAGLGATNGNETKMVLTRTRKMRK